MVELAGQKVFVSLLRRYLPWHTKKNKWLLLLSYKLLRSIAVIVRTITLYLSVFLMLI